MTSSPISTATLADFDHVCCAVWMIITVPSSKPMITGGCFSKAWDHVVLITLSNPVQVVQITLTDPVQAVQIALTECFRGHTCTERAMQYSLTPSWTICHMG